MITQEEIDFYTAFGRFLSGPLEDLRSSEHLSKVFARILRLNSEGDYSECCSAVMDGFRWPHPREGIEWGEEYLNLMEGKPLSKKAEIQLMCWVSYYENLS